MDSHAIRCFQRVFEKESIHQAAKDLCMTPQGVSRVISALEGEMQTALFIRSRKGMEATPEGRYFYEHTQELTRQLLDLQLGMQALKRKKAGLHIGFSCGVLNILSIHVLKGVMACHPDKSLEWVEDFNEKIVQLIAEDSLSCGFVSARSGQMPFSSRKSIALASKPSSMRAILFMTGRPSLLKT